MRQLVLFMHVSLDGFVAGPCGEMDWIKVDDDMFEYAGKQTDISDTALYGRITYEMMEDYWPTAGDHPYASKHDKQHAEWYNKVTKIIVSKTMEGEHLPNTSIISHNIPQEIIKLKEAAGKDIILFGSPSAAHLLMEENLIDDYWIFVNPILLGSGILLFNNIKHRMLLNLTEHKIFVSGVVGLHYKSVASTQG